MQKADIGVIGMAVMGQNLALNMEDKGYTVSVYNRTAQRTEDFVKERCRDKTIIPTYTLEDFVNSLRRPAKILLMVKAGQPTDEFIDKLMPLLEEQAIIIDGGNSYFRDTERRRQRVEEKGIYYLGTGISGGESGALHGPSIMPGGDYEAYQQIEEIFTKIAAQTEDGPCCAFLGPSSAGHFVKMVHNGIEYAVMEILAECYQALRIGLGLQVEEIQRIFSEWNKGELNSYLLEITTHILEKIDQETKNPLVEVILDKAEQKGTGKWTSQAALDLGVSVPTISAAVDARIISSYKDDRVKMAKKLGESLPKCLGERKEFLFQLPSAYYAAVLVSYVQGLHLLKVASAEFNYGLNLSEVARIWKGGCIIRAKLLNIIKDIYLRNPDLPHLFFSDTLANIIRPKIESLRMILIEIRKLGIPAPALNAAMDYFESCRSSVVPANLIQAQRDYFGAHTYQRIDKEGSFHTQW